MIETFTDSDFKPNHYDSKYVKSLFSPIVNNLLRHFSICTNHNHIISSLEKVNYNELSEMVSAPSSYVEGIVIKFLRNLIYFEKFLRTCKFTSRHSAKGRYRFVRLCLHKIHRIAPVFDYERAKQNLEILHAHLDALSFWPQFTTQIAVVIYVTDKNDKHNKYTKKLLQKNIRVLCSCSAYAFHRTRKKMRIL